MWKIAMLLINICLSDSLVIQNVAAKVFMTEQLMSEYRDKLSRKLSDSDILSGVTTGSVGVLKTKCNDPQDEECQQFILNEINHNARRKRSITHPMDEPSRIRFCFDGQNIELYDPETEICCYGTIRKSHGAEECCNKTIIDSTKHYCCNNVIHNRTEGEACCGMEVYDTSHYICCNGYLQYKAKHTECCDNKAYDARKEICCFNRNVFNKTQGDQCCGMTVYNSKTDVCCGTKVQPTYNGNRRKTDLCCGEKSYHSECYNCIDNKLSPIHGDQLCCDGKFKERVFGNDTGCCSTEVIDKTKDVCVNNEILSRSTSTEGTTVYNTSVFYMNATRDYDPKSPVERTSVVIVIVCSASVFLGLIICLIIARQQRHLWKCRFRKLDEFTEPLQNIFCCGSPELAESHVPLYVSPPEQCNNVLFVPNMNKHTDDFDTSKSNTIMIIGDLGLIKTGPNVDENIYANYFKSTWTQTCPKKVSNRRNVLGKNFDYTDHLNLNKTTMQMPHSEVKLTLPQSTLREGDVEVNASTFRSLTEIQKKFDLSAAEKMASPAVEFVLTGITTLKDYAVVVMPFVGAEEDLRVKKFKSDDGLKTVPDTLDVPKQGKSNEELDLYYIVKGSFVFIYTKSFSGFYCTTCKHGRELKLRAFIYGSYKRFLSPLRYEVRTMLYVADEIMKFADYKERMNNNEACQGRILKKDKLLKLPDCLNDRSYIEASIIPTDSHDDLWMHKLHPVNGKPIYDAVQRLQLSDIVEKCEDCSNCHLAQNEIPYCIEWYLRNKQDEHPSYTFQCIIDINTTGVNEKVPDFIVIDELQLRQEDRYPVEEDFNSRCIKGVKEYIDSGILPRRRTELLKMLVSQTKSQGQTTEDIFFHLQEKYTSKGLLEAVATAMKSLRMYDDIDKLTKIGFLPRTLLSDPMQSVSVDEPPNVESLVYPLDRPAVHGQDDAQCTAEYQNLHSQPHGANLVPCQCREQPRPEVDHINFTSLSSGESTLTNDKIDHRQSNEYVYSEMGPVRRETDSNVQSVESDPTICPKLPVQEHASMDETDLKQSVASSCTSVD